AAAVALPHIVAERRTDRKLCGEIPEKGDSQPIGHELLDEVTCNPRLQLPEARIEPRNRHRHQVGATAIELAHDVDSVLLAAERGAAGGEGGDGQAGG